MSNRKESFSYLVKYEKRDGVLITKWVGSLADAERSLRYCHRKKIEATVTKRNGEIVGRVFDDVSKKSGYNWFILIG